jgi:subtilisin-like proprotein convertase family protein
VGALALSPLAQAQVVFYSNDANPAIGAGPNAFPFNVSTFTTLHFYRADQLQAAGVAPGAVLTDFAFASSNTATPSGTSAGTYNSPVALLQIGHVFNDLNPGAWTTTLDTPTVIHDSAISGPYTFPWTTPAWVSLPGFATAGFTWDGIRDIGVFYTTGAGITGGVYCRTSPVDPRFGVTVNNATVQAPTTTGYFAMKARLTFNGVLPQVNTPQATMTINGSGSATHLFGTELLSLNLTSTTAPGNPFFLLVSPSFTGGHLPLSGQSFDLGFAPAVFSDVLLATPGGFFPFLTGPFIPWGALDGSGNYSLLLPLACGAPIAKTFVQAAIADPGHPDGVRITAQPSVDVKPACRFASGSAFPIAIPDAGASVTATITLPPGTLIGDVDAVVQISHPAAGDLNITLDLNGSPMVTLCLAGPADTSDLTGLNQFSDEGLMGIGTAIANSGTTIIPSRFVPDAPLSAFDGLDASGVWTLTVQDLTATNVGSLQGFWLLLNGTE